MCYARVLRIVLNFSFLKVFPSIAIYPLLRLVSRNLTTRYLAVTGGGSVGEWWLRQIKPVQLTITCTITVIFFTYLGVDTLRFADLSVELLPDNGSDFQDPHTSALVHHLALSCLLIPWDFSFIFRDAIDYIHNQRPVELYSISTPPTPRPLSRGLILTDHWSRH